MHEAFGYVIWIVCGIGLVIAAFALASSGKVWEEIGRRGLLMEGDSDLGGRGGIGAGGAGAMSPAAIAERDTEIRQMLQARNARRERRGEEPLDIEAELRRLTAPAPPAIDDALRSEIRELVVARNHRRARRGQPPLDVEAEVERQIAELTPP